MQLDSLLREIRLAVRALCARPGHSALVVLVLSAGLGCVLFMLSLINGFVLRPMPFPQAEELVVLGITEQDNEDDLGQILAADLLTLEPLLAARWPHAAYRQATINLSDVERPQRYDGSTVHGDLLGVLGIQPALGRSFQPADFQPGAPAVVVISDRLWRSRYLADPHIIGRQVRANAQPATVIGVAPPDFHFPERQDVWLPSRIDPAAPDPDLEMEVVVRAPAAEHTAVRSVFDAWFAERLALEPTRFKPQQTRLFPVHQRFVSMTTRNVLVTMLLAVVMVLVVACANAANLMLGRAWSERQRIALQAAIGAGRGRLLLQPLLQSLLLAGCAGLLSLAWAQACVQWLMRELIASDDGAPQWLRVDIDAGLALAAVAVALLTGVLAGVLPAWRASRVNLSDALRERGGSSRGLQRLTRGLVVAELVLSLIVLIAAGVLVRGVEGILNADIGLQRTEEVLTARLALFPEQYPDAAARLRLFERLSEQIRSDADVVDASVASVLPGLIGASDLVALEGQAPPEDGWRSVEVGLVDSRFLSTWGMSLHSGRDFSSTDRAGQLPVALVDRDFVSAHFPDGQALGKRIQMVPEDPASPWRTIIGVVDKMHLDDLDEPRQPGVLLPLTQQPPSYASIVVRLRSAPSAYAQRLAAHLKQLDPDTPLYWVRGYSDVARQSTFGALVVASAFSAFGVVALVLSAIGLYGVVSWSLLQRTREIGVRRALGAPGWQLMHGLVRSTGWLLLRGIALGLGLGLPFADLLTALLPELQPPGLAAVLPAVLVLAVAATLAVLVPARRALHVDPLVALRSD